MAIELKQAPLKGRNKPATWTYGTTWRDHAGVEWDVAYVHRFESLGDSIQGLVVGPWNPYYNEVRNTWIGPVERWPAALIICMNMEDVETCLSYAREFDLPIAIYYDEDNLTEEAIIEGCLLIDVSLFK